MAWYGSSFMVGFTVGVLALLLLVVMMGRGILYNSDGGREQGPRESGTSNIETNLVVAETNGATVSVATQAAGTSTMVALVVLDAVGWAVVHEVESGHILNALGAARLDTGEHANVVVELLRGTEPGREYAVVLYVDNGNKEFELRGDLPMIDAGGNPIMQTFRTYGGGAAGE